MTDFEKNSQESKSPESDQWISAPDPDEGKLTGSDIAKGVAGFAAELGSDLLQTLLSVVILVVCPGLGLLIGFFIDGGSISTIGTTTIILGVIGLAIGFFVNHKRGHSVLFF